MENNNDQTKRTLSIKKTFNAPVKLVWEAFTLPEHLIKWWAPKGMAIEVVAHDFTVGGKWQYTMPMPDGSLFVSQGTYLEIQEFEKIVTSADFMPMTEGVELHVEFHAAGEQTNFSFSVVHATEEYCRQQEKMGFYNGWGSALERLETLVNSLSE